MATRRSSQAAAAGAPPPPPARPSGRYADRADDTHCRIHRCFVDAVTGWCPMAQAWWVPRFRCPHCAGPLWDNGYCPSCTPRTGTFPGDFFEARWDAGSGREWGHYVRVATGPTAAPTRAEIDGYLAALRACLARVGPAGPMREPGEEAPEWVTEAARA